MTAFLLCYSFAHSAAGSSPVRGLDVPSMPFLPAQVAFTDDVAELEKQQNVYDASTQKYVKLMEKQFETLRAKTVAQHEKQETDRAARLEAQNERARDQLKA